MMEFFEFVHCDFGVLAIENVYQEYDDIPLLFSLYSEQGVKFIATALSPKAFLAVRFFESTKFDLFAKQIDINTAFYRGGSICWVFKINDNGTTKDCKQYKVDEVPKKYFPLAGAKLVGYADMIYDEAVEAIRQEALQNHYDCFSYRLLTKSITVPELCRVSEFFNSTYKKISERSKLKVPVKAKKRLLPSEYGCDLQVLPRAGSIVLQFVALHNDTILENTEYDKVIKRLVDILDFQDPTLDAFNGVEYSLIDDVRRFGGLIARIGCSSELTAATASGSVYHRSIKASDMKKRASNLKIESRSSSKVEYRDGRFYAANLNTKHFNFVESGTNKVFSGKFAPGFKGISLNLEDMSVYEVEFEDEAIHDPIFSDKIVTTNYRVMSVKRKGSISLDELV